MPPDFGCVPGALAFLCEAKKSQRRRQSHPSRKRLTVLPKVTHQHDRAPDHGHAGHDHASHAHAPKDFGPAFAIGILLNTAFIAAEVVYGLRGTSILAALANAMVLTGVTGAIAWEAVLRLAHPAAVEGGTVMAVAALGIVVNVATALLFMSGRKDDLNVRAAFAHMAGDAAIAAGVVVAGFAMLRTGWLWLDPAVSLGVALLVLVATWGLLKDSVALSLQGVPRELDAAAVGRWLAALPGVAGVHDLHIWAMSTTENALTAHLVYPGGFPGDACLRGICEELRAHQAIAHVTLQVETGGDCVAAGAPHGAPSAGLAFGPP